MLLKNNESNDTNIFGYIYKNCKTTLDFGQNIKQLIGYNISVNILTENQEFPGNQVSAWKR